MRHEFIGFAVERPARMGDPFRSSASGRTCRELIKARQRRQLHFRSSLFSDPAWDMLLVLFAANSEGRKFSIAAVGRQAGVPGTTALRWIDVLEREGLVEREEDPTDGRRTFLNLSEAGFESMRAYVDGESRRAALAI
jgi:DNA-binding MarR family transcriptional regulator